MTSFLFIIDLNRFRFSREKIWIVNGYIMLNKVLDGVLDVVFVSTPSKYATSSSFIGEISKNEDLFPRLWDTNPVNQLGIIFSVSNPDSICCPISFFILLLFLDRVFHVISGRPPSCLTLTFHP